MVIQKRQINVISFFVLMITGILLSAFLKNENLWDLANYHYYNAFAFFNDRTDLDVVPGAVNTFFNPLLDLPFYLLVQHFNDSPSIVYAFQGIWGGLFLFALFQICLLFFGYDRKGISKALLVLLLAMTARATGGQFGAYTNEIPVGFFILWGLYLLLKMIKFPETQSLKKFLLAGLIMGIGLALKQTVITYCVASGITLMICYKYLKKPFLCISFFAAGGLIGYLVINGYFMYKSWILYGNPFFPFLNGIFHSPYFFDFNYRDARFVPNLSEVLMFPYLWNLHIRDIDDTKYNDLRMLVFYNLPIIGFLILAARHKLKSFFEKEQAVTAIYIFCFLSLMIWMLLFSYLRYACVVEVVGGLLLVHLFTQYDYKKHQILFCFHNVLICLLIMTPLFYPQYKKAHETKIIDLQKIDLPDNALLKIYGVPSSFVIPEFVGNKKIKTATYYRKCTNYSRACIFDDGTDLAEQGAFLEKRNKMEKEHDGPVIYIYDKGAYKLKLKEKYVKEVYKSRKKICEKSYALGLIKDKDDCLREADKSFEEDVIIAKQHIAQKYYCTKLRNNINLYLRICVPNELKTQILGEQTGDSITN